MNSRLQELVNRGYPVEDVLRLSSYTKDELDAAVSAAFKHISRNCTSVDTPKAIFIGGQPGCGKSSMLLSIKNKNKNIIGIGIDNYRMYHPKYLEMENYIIDHWKNKEETMNDSSGNDIACMTHLFAGDMSDRLIEMSIAKNYNMVLDWGMREPKAPLTTMKMLKDNHYQVMVLVIAVESKLSYSACNLRNDLLINSPHIIRKVPKNFHDECVRLLPISIKTIYEIGTANNYIDYFDIVNRNGNSIWKNKINKDPGDLLKDFIEKED